MITAFLAFIVSGTIKGTLGVGLPIAAVGLMTLSIDPRLAISLMVFPIMFANIWQYFRSTKALWIAKHYWLFAVVLLLSLLSTTFFTARISTSLLLAFIGLVIVIFSLMNLAFTPPPIPSRFDRLAQTVCGIVAGVMGGLTAMWSPAIATYLISRGTSKDDFVGISGFLFLVGSVPLCIGFWQNGMLTGPVALVSAGMILPTLIGFSIGEWIRRRLDADKFKTIVLVFFLFVGLNLIRKAFTS